MLDERINRLVDFCNRSKTIREHLSNEILELEESVKEKQEFKESLVKARTVIIEAQKVTQEWFKEYLENLVTLGLKIVFEDRNYSFKVEFGDRVDRMEVKLFVMDGDDKLDLKSDLGGGVVDVVSFILRIALWSIMETKTRAIFILDEPFKFLGRELLPKVGEMLRELVRKLSIQIIMITHEKELSTIADRAYLITHNGRYSEIKLLDGGVNEEEIS